MNAVGELSHEELGRDFGTADKSVLDTLVHVYAVRHGASLKTEQSTASISS